jgi:hypothetical protein
MLSLPDARLDVRVIDALGRIALTGSELPDAWE